MQIEMSKKRSYSNDTEISEPAIEELLVGGAKHRKLNTSLSAEAAAFKDNTNADSKNGSSRGRDNQDIVDAQLEDVIDPHLESQRGSNNGAVLNGNSGSKSHIGSESDSEDEIIELFGPFEKLSIDE